MIKVTKQKGQETYGVTEFICDSIEDKNNIELDNIAMGSTCFIIADASLYMLGGDKKWYAI